MKTKKGAELMENVNEEKSLITVDNSIFSKIKNFFRRFFTKKDYAELREENVEEVKQSEEPEYVQPKLFNYDNPQNYRELNKNGEENSDNESEVVPEVDYSSNEEVQENSAPENTQEPEQPKNEYVGISKYFEDVDDNYIGKSKKKAKTLNEDGYEDKEELEQKLMNYYASIKKVMQQ